MPGPTLRNESGGYVLPTDKPAPIATSGGSTGDAVVRTLVEKYGVPPDQAAALAARYAAGAPDEGIAGQAMTDVADREIQRLKRINFYVKAKQDMLDGKNVDAETQKYVQAVDAEHKRMVQERAAAAQRAQDFNKDFVASHPDAKLGAGGAAIDIPIPRPPDTEGWEAVDYNGKRYYKRPPAPVAFTPEHPVVRTAKAAMDQFGVDPLAAGNFALMLHGMGPEGQ